MYLIFLMICLLFSLIFIFKNEKDNFLTKISLLVMIVTICLSILLVNLAWAAGPTNGTVFLTVFEFSSVSTIFNVVKVLVTITLVSMVVYFYAKQRK